MDDDTNKELGQALIDAIKSGDGGGVYDAFEALSRACAQGGKEPDEDDMGSSSGKPPAALVLALGKDKGK